MIIQLIIFQEQHIINNTAHYYKFKEYMNCIIYNDKSVNLLLFN